MQSLESMECAPSRPTGAALTGFPSSAHCPSGHMPLCGRWLGCQPRPWNRMGGLSPRRSQGSVETGMLAASTASGPSGLQEYPIMAGMLVSRDYKSVHLQCSL